jgi:hypothetical protein
MSCRLAVALVQELVFAQSVAAEKIEGLTVEPAQAVEVVAAVAAAAVAGTQFAVELHTDQTVVAGCQMLQDSPLLGLEDWEGSRLLERLGSLAAGTAAEVAAEAVAGCFEHTTAAVRREVGRHLAERFGRHSCSLGPNTWRRNEMRIQPRRSDRTRSRSTDTTSRMKERRNAMNLRRDKRR